MYKTTGLTHLINSTKYSLQGLKSAFKNETAFRHECFLACILIPLAFWLGDTKIEIALMISSVLLVMAVELLNSAVEAVVDRIGTERHELSGRAIIDITKLWKQNEGTLKGEVSHGRKKIPEMV